MSQTIGEYGVKIIKKFHYEGLKDFISSSELDKKIKEIKKNNPILYADNKEIAELFLKKFNDENA